ncbi:MAG: amidohydrolase [Oscillospiraceae bacterium]|jgi:predicted TIM-barrel fold metal-dependent hydrolase|nr:amidohydrolase [Oscillospiraceae bacterium]
MEELCFFDCNAMVGKRRIKNPGSFYETEELIRKMEYYRIGKALVCHAAACEYEAMTGNYMLADEIKQYPNLCGMWVLLPHHTGEFPNASDTKTLLKENNIPAVTMLPRTNGHSTEEWICGDLYEMLEEHRVPLIISSEQLSYENVHEILSNHPQLRLILTNLHYSCGRNLYPLLNKFEHLYIETIGFKVHGGIEDICNKFGAKRLIFGSCAPVYSGGAAVGMISYAQISNQEKRLIASENL